MGFLDVNSQMLFLLISTNYSDNYDVNEILRQNKAKEAGGSPIYMAPETLIHNNFTFSSDIWALGCILYELCTLQAAFDFVEVWFSIHLIDHI